MIASQRKALRNPVIVSERRWCILVASLTLFLESLQLCGSFDVYINTRTNIWGDNVLKFAHTVNWSVAKL